MKTLIKAVTLFLVFSFATNLVNSQCVSFARGIAKPLLAPFIHDGNYNATFMEEGESAELHKTFFRGEKYRLAFAAVEALPKNIRIRILNDQMKVIFDNAEHNYVYVWDFESESTENLIIHVKIPENPQSDIIKGGCIAVMFGIEQIDKRKR